MHPGYNPTDWTTKAQQWIQHGMNIGQPTLSFLVWCLICGLIGGHVDAGTSDNGEQNMDIGQYEQGYNGLNLAAGRSLLYNHS